MIFGLSSHDKKVMLLSKQHSEGKNFSTTISTGTAIQGIVRFQSSIFINGHIDSELLSPNGGNDDSLIWIGPQGYVKGSLHAKQVHIEGTVEGDVHSEENLTIYATANIDGSCFYNHVSMENGAQITGRFNPKYNKESVSFEKNDQATNFELPILEAKDAVRKRSSL